MVRGIRFNDKRFETKDNDNLLCPITENIIILCSSSKLMHSFSKEIISTINGEAEYNDYDCDDTDVGKAHYETSFRLQDIIDIDGQKIFLGIEPAIIYRAKQADDVWFLDWIGHDESYREKIYPLTVFKGSRKKWDEGADAVYKMIANGRYGCYDGKWLE